MSIRLHDVFAAGGKPLIELLDYCVFSVQMDPVFVFLAGEFRMHPACEKALALYDVFCAAGAPARVSADDVLPPLDFRLDRAIEPIRNPPMRIEDPDADEPNLVPSVQTPGKFLFDVVAGELERRPDGAIAAIGRSYDPSRDAQENLPGGKMTAPQRMFVERIWKPQLRPYLVAAGFRRIANIGEP